MIAWGADLMTTNVHIWPLVEEARRRGAKVIVIEPRRSRTAERADWHVRVNVGTDAALALGIMHVLARDGLVDRDYVARATLGFDRVEREVLPRFTPAHVAAITGVSAADVERLADLYGRARAPFIRLGEGMSRTMQGGQAIRAVSLLPGVVGAYAKRGGGALLMTAASFGLDLSVIRRPSGPSATREVNHSRLGEALLTMKDPPIRALFVAANNPAVTCPDAQAVRRGLAREDLFTVVHDPFLSDTARFADLVLPAATYLETEDLHRSYGTYYMQRAAEVVSPQGESRSNRRVAQQLASRLRVTDAVFSAIVEPVFGQTKEVRRFRRFSLRGYARAAAEWALICLTHNLLKLVRARQPSGKGCRGVGTPTATRPGKNALLPGRFFRPGPNRVSSKLFFSRLSHGRGVAHGLRRSGRP